MNIHPTAIVEQGAELGEGVVVGPFCTVSAKARLYEGVVLESHVAVKGETEIGAGTIVHPFSVIGGPPQHLGYKDEETKLVIGANNIIREQVTMNPGTVAGGGVTQIGDGGFFMVGAHIGHDCTVGDNAIFANNATLGGHVVVGDNVFLGGLSAVHQHCRVGSYTFIGGCAAVVTDIIPYASVMGNHARLIGLNIVGMKRRGLSRPVIHALRGAYRMLFNDNDTFKERVDSVREKYGDIREVMQIIKFVEHDATRALMTPTP